jgi:hypothetical protein
VVFFKVSSLGQGAVEKGNLGAYQTARGLNVFNP